MLQSVRLARGLKMNTPMTKAEKKAAYDAWYLAEIDKGLADLEAGLVLTDEQAEAEMSVHMASLREKYGKKAA